MNCFAEAFGRARAAGRSAIVPFVVAGDPDLETTRDVLLALAGEGAAAIELGVPFSDPVADGPTIQRAAQRSLARGTRLPAILDLARTFSAQSSVPLVLFSYLNPLLHYGMERLYRDLESAGVRALLVTDLPHEESAAVRRDLAQRGIELISLVAPTTSEARLAAIAASATGFLYAISRSGVTGADRSPDDARALLARIRRHSALPVALGFGISTAAQVEQACSHADAAVVGSALVATIERHHASPDLIPQVRSFMSQLLLSEVPHASRNA